MTRPVTLIGLGRIGLTNDPPDSSNHAILTHAKAIKLSEEFHLEAAVDPDAAARSSFMDRYSAPAFPSLTDLPVDFGQDIVVIACPTQFHALTVNELLGRARPEVIVMEKPMGRSLAEAASIAESCSSAGSQLFVNFHRSVLPSTARVRQLIRSEVIHAPYAGHALVSGGRLTNGSHMVDLLIDWLGPVVATHSDEVDGGLWLHFEGCRVLLSEVAPETFSIFEVTLLARNGRLRFDGWNDRWWWEGVEADPLTAGYECLSEPILVHGEGVSTFMAGVYADLGHALAGRPSSLRREDRALAVHDVLSGWV